VTVYRESASHTLQQLSAGKKSFLGRQTTVAEWRQSGEGGKMTVQRKGILLATFLGGKIAVRPSRR